MDAIKTFLLKKDELVLFTDCMPEDTDGILSPYSLTFGAIAEKEGTASTAGMLTAHAEGEVLSVDWVYVKPEYRRTGVASKLLDIICGAAYESGGVDMVFSILSEKEADLRSFFRDTGFTILPMADRGQFIARLSDIRFADFGKSHRGICKETGEVLPKHLRALEKTALNNGDVSIGVSFPIDPAKYSEKSLVHFNKSGAPDGVILAKETMCSLDSDKQEKAMNISWLYCSEQNGFALAELLSAFIMGLTEDDPDILITFASLNDSSWELGHRLFPNAVYEPYYMAFMDLTV